MQQNILPYIKRAARNRRLRNSLGGLLLMLLALTACKKDDTYRFAKPTSEVTLNTYEFLQTQQGLYDTLLHLIDIAGLADTLKRANVTFFAPQDYSIRTGLYNLNFTRAKYGFPGNWTLDSVPIPVWDTLLRRYMMYDKVGSDSLDYADGVMVTSLSYGYPMNGKTAPTNASGIVSGGPTVIQLSDMNRSRFVRDWSTSSTQSIDLKTGNGWLHVLESKHVFGFVSFVPMAFPYSLNPVQAPYLGLPFPIPGTIEVEDFDDGGEGLSYHDGDVNNNGNQYRTTGVDIENCGEGGFNIGWTGTGEWLEYTVEVSQSGDYDLGMRLAGDGTGGGEFRMEVDGAPLTGTIHVNGTGGWQNYITSNTTVTLTAGKHVIRLVLLSGGLNYNKFTFTKL